MSVADQATAKTVSGAAKDPAANATPFRTVLEAAANYAANGTKPRDEVVVEKKGALQKEADATVKVLEEVKKALVDLKKRLPDKAKLEDVASELTQAKRAFSGKANPSDGVGASRELLDVWKRTADVMSELHDNLQLWFELQDIGEDKWDWKSVVRERNTAIRNHVDFMCSALQRGADALRSGESKTSLPSNLQFGGTAPQYESSGDGKHEDPDSEDIDNDSALQHQTKKGPNPLFAPPPAVADTKTDPTTTAPKTRLRILTLDGGGVRGQIEVVLLRALDCAIKRVCKEKRLTPKEHVSDYFDVVYGTSTGGLLAMALRKRKPLKEIAQLYKALPPTVFGRGTDSAGFFADVLARVVERLNAWPVIEHDPARLIKAVTTNLFDNSDPIFHTLHHQDGAGVAKFAVVSMQMGDPDKPVVLRNFDTTYSDGTHDRNHWLLSSDLKCSTVACATAAAPLYFPKVKIGDKLLLDGGLGHNHPGRCVLHHFGKDIKHSMTAWVSLGTGASSPATWTSSFLIACLTNGDAISAEVQRFMETSHEYTAYHRFQPEADTLKAKRAQTLNEKQGLKSRAPDTPKTLVGDVDLTSFDQELLKLMRWRTRVWVKKHIARIEAAAIDLVNLTYPVS